MPARGIEEKIFILTGEGRLGQLYALHYSTDRAKDGMIVFFTETRLPVVVAKEYIQAGAVNAAALEMLPYVQDASAIRIIIAPSTVPVDALADYRGRVAFTVIEAKTPSAIEACLEKTLALSARESIVCADEPHPWRSIDYIGGKALVLPLEIFLARKGKNRQYYRYCRAAAYATQRLGIEGPGEYAERYFEDPLLPSRPDGSYKDEWTSPDDFFDYVDYYPTLEENQKAALAANLTNRHRYNEFYRKVDRRLRPKPWEYWKAEWVSDSWSFRGSMGNGQFLSGLRRIPPPAPASIERKVVVTGTFYSYEEGRAANTRLGIESSVEYEFRCGEDPSLPKGAKRHYGSSFSWEYFAPCTTLASELYGYRATRRIIISQRLSTPQKYFAYRKKDRRLSPDPESHFGDWWRGWKVYLDPSCNAHDLYAYGSARKVIIAEKLTTRTAYEAHCKKDPLLPPNPEKHFGTAWAGWRAYLEPEYDIIQVMILVRLHGITDVGEYHKKRWEIDGLPIDPPTTFGARWPGWKKFLTVPLAELQFLARR